MREVKLQNGNILHMPDHEQRPKEFHCCSCHERMGNDFYFLPTESCLRPDGVCDKALQ